jgi:hypothetical protein
VVSNDTQGDPRHIDPWKTPNFEGNSSRKHYFETKNTGALGRSPHFVGGPDFPVLGQNCEFNGEGSGNVNVIVTGNANNIYCGYPSLNNIKAFAGNSNEDKILIDSYGAGEKKESVKFKKSARGKGAREGKGMGKYSKAK